MLPGDLQKKVICGCTCKKIEFFHTSALRRCSGKLSEKLNWSNNRAEKLVYAYARPFISVGFNTVFIHHCVNKERFDCLDIVRKANLFRIQTHSKTALFHFLNLKIDYEKRSSNSLGL